MDQSVNNLLNNLNTLYVTVIKEDDDETIEASVVYSELERSIKECVLWLGLYRNTDYKNSWVHHNAPPISGDDKFKYVNCITNTIITESDFLLKRLESTETPINTQLILGNLWTAIFRLQLVFN